MKTKSAMAGAWTAPPARGLMMAEIYGATPLASVVAHKDVGVTAQRQHAFLNPQFL